MTFVQQLLANPIAVALDGVLAYHGPDQLATWLRDQTAVVELVPLDGLAEGIWAHPFLLKLGRKPIRRALEAWSVPESAELLDVMLGVAPAVAQEQAPPALQPQLTEALRAMCVQLGQPAAFPWFCRQCNALRAKVLSVLDDNPADQR